MIGDDCGQCILRRTRRGLGFPGGSGGACNGGDLGLIPGLGRSPGGGRGNLNSCLENPPGQRSLVGYSPQGHTESDTTEVRGD